jgi:uncharacterized membrane protein YeiH
LLTRDIYVTAALVGSTAYVVCAGWGAPQPLALGIGFLTGLIVRVGAITRHWALPAYPKA